MRRYVEDFFDIPTIQNQLAKRQLTLFGKVNRNSEETLPAKLLTAWCNHKRQAVVVLHSNKKKRMQNIALIVSTVDRSGSLKLWAHLALDKKYCKYLINGLGNTPTYPLGPPNAPTAERPQLPYPHSPPRTSQSPPTPPPPRQRTRPSPIP